METKTKRLWHLHYSVPKDESKGRPWAVNKSLAIGAETMQSALAEAQRIEPDATFWQINHGGLLHALV